MVMCWAAEARFLAGARILPYNLSEPASRLQTYTLEELCIDCSM